MVSILDSVKKIFSVGHNGLALGIDIGASSIKVVLIEKVDEKAVLRNYGELSLGPRAGVAIGQATSLAPEKIAEALRDLLKELGIVPGHTTIAIPFSASLLSVVELPEIEKKEFESMIMNEARRYIPVPINEVSMDWWILPKRKLGARQAGPVVSTNSTEAKQVDKVEVIIAAIHNEVIKKYELIKKDAHIPSDSSHFEIEIFSTLRAIAGRDLSPIMVVDIGAGSTKLVLVEEGVVRGSHVVSMGGQDITIGLTSSRGLSFEQAEEIKCRAGVVGEEEGRDVLVVAELLLANIMNEAARFAENYERKHDTKITKIIFVGGGSRLLGLEKIVAKNFPNASVVVGDPFSRLDTPAFLDNTLHGISASFAVAVGLALKGLEE